MKRNRIILAVMSVMAMALCGQKSAAQPAVYRQVAFAQAIKMYQALYDAGVEAELILNDRAPHGNLGPEAAAAIKSFILRVLFP